MQRIRMKHDRNEGEYSADWGHDGFRCTLMRTLDGAGFSVTPVSDGRQGLERLRANCDTGRSVDFLVTDILMSMMSGTELIRVISAAGTGIPVFVTTSLHGAHRTPRQEFPPNPRGFEKPPDPDQLADSVSGLTLSE